ncbi:hypothetical protein L249_6306 [Ophiocordyceps polyrhachis-furcata BCC 54312]|uniref:Ribosomal protein L5 C-terminal domain-containing protein n=1 Tax=Ophiocordyceps polyrhachis-furcata BCC 54312 TaxID=1330021 RepID=A0A367L1B4_9HYPO|nr:hypothetical protein L249_6306 [Ophiocordyceps polyrhachis-furcata BCC 54312]
MAAAARDGLRVARALGRPCAPTITPALRRRAATAAKSSPDWTDLESTSSFTSPAPGPELVKEFDEANQKRWTAMENRELKLPGNRYQYHPPKFYRGPLHPIQIPKPSDSIARDFVPGPFNYPRLKHTYESTIAADLVTLNYSHVPLGTVVPKSRKGTLRSWDDSSPYFKNRPLRRPRGTSSSRQALVERKISWHNIPEIRAVTLHAFAPLSGSDKEYLHVARAVLQAISGQFPDVTSIKTNVSQWGIKKGKKGGAVVTLRGAQAYEFVDKLVTLVLPKIKDWPGIKGTSGDSSGNLGLGIEPQWMLYFPEIEYNYDMFPEPLVPGLHIIMHTSATSDRQGRLLLQALGFPFYDVRKKGRTNAGLRQWR